MTFFPHNPLRRTAASAANPPAPVRQRLTRDILWNQPVFKAPALANPRIALDPLPFLANRPAPAARRG
jgi:hypothetical protein